MSEPAEIRLKRLAMRSWRRGTKEMDLILGPFADRQMVALTPDALDSYERILSENDQDLYRWVSGQEPAPSQHGEIIADIREFHGIS